MVIALELETAPCDVAAAVEKKPKWSPDRDRGRKSGKRPTNPRVRRG